MSAQTPIKYPIMQQISIYLASTLTVMAGAAISAAMNGLIQDFTSVPNYQLVTRLVLTITSLAIAVGSIFAGWLVDKWGRKPLLLLSLILYAIFGTTGFYFKYLNLNPTVLLYLMLGGRVLLGFAVAGIATSCTTLIADHYLGEKRNQVIGYQSTAISFGGAIFIVIGGALADINWNFAFLVYIMSLVYLPIIYLTITEPSTKENLLGNEDSDKTIEVKKANSYVTVLTSYAIVFIMMVLFYFIPPNLATYIHSFGPTKEVFIGITIAMSSLTAGLVGLIYKTIRNKISYQIIFIIAFVFFSTGMVVISIANGIVVTAIGSAILGIGWGFLMPNLFSWIASDISKVNRGRIIGIYLTVLYFGQFISPIIAQPILNNSNFSFLFLLGGIIGYTLITIPIIFLSINVYKKRKEKKKLKTANSPEVMNYK